MNNTIKKTIMLILAAAFIALSLSGCNCRRIEVIEEKEIPIPKEYPYIEYYTITEPYFTQELKQVPKTIQKIQDIKLEACADTLRITNPSDTPLTIKLNTNAEGYFLFHGKEKLRPNAMQEPSYLLQSYYTDKHTPWLDTSQRVTLRPHQSIDINYRGLLEPHLTSCRDKEGNKCNSYEHCDNTLGNGIFDLQKIREHDITLINPKVTQVTIYEEDIQTVKKYRKVVKNRTIIKTDYVYELRNVSTKRWTCK